MRNIILYKGSDTRLWTISRTLISKKFVKVYEKSQFLNGDVVDGFMSVFYNINTLKFIRDFDKIGNTAFRCTIELLKIFNELGYLSYSERIKINNYLKKSNEIFSKRYLVKNFSHVLKEV